MMEGRNVWVSGILKRVIIFAHLLLLPSDMVAAVGCIVSYNVDAWMLLCRMLKLDLCLILPSKSLI